MTKSVFFIDDDEMVLHLLERVCKGIDDISTVKTASHGKDALEKLSLWLETGKELPSAMFVDINMPIMNGFEFLTRFCQLREENAALLQIIPIVMLTSSADSQDVEKALGSNVVDRFITKPSNILEVEQVIREAIQ